jgi:hypothetical protein
VSLIDEPKAWDSKQSGQYLKTSTGALVMGVDYDLITTTYPLITREIYTFTLSGGVVRTVEVNYLTASKKDLDTVVIT